MELATQRCRWQLQLSDIFAAVFGIAASFGLLRYGLTSDSSIPLKLSLFLFAGTVGAVAGRFYSGTWEGAAFGFSLAWIVASLICFPMGLFIVVAFSVSSIVGVTNAAGFPLKGRFVKASTMK